MDVKMYLQSPIPRWIAMTAIVSTGVAATGVTYFTTRNKFYKDLDAMVEEQVGNTRVFLDSLAKEKGPLETLAEKNYEEREAARVDEIIETAAYRSDETVEEGEPSLEEISHNIFTDAKETDFDFETELPLRTPEKPYIIEHDEFYASENQMITLTWFDGDEVLSDEKDEHVPDIDRVVGEANLQRFGYGSRDPNVIYIRNEKMEVDFEVVRNDGKYTEQVLGFMQHDDKPGVRKFRSYDD